jgi:hypothetical protein
MQGDTWYYDLTDGAWSQVTQGSTPGVRHGAVAVGYGDSLYLHGGSTLAPVILYGDLWRFRRADGWVRLETGPIQPIARSYHAGALLVKESGAFMVMFGGANCTGSCLCRNDLWMLDLHTHEWQAVQTISDIDTRYHHSLVVHGDAAYTFGGESYVPRYMYHNSVVSVRLFDDRPMIVFLLVCISAILSIIWILCRPAQKVKAYRDHIQ